MKRRSFLAGLTAGAVAAPTIVRASSLMKLWVPKAVELPPLVFGFDPGSAAGDSLGLSLWQRDLVDAVAGYGFKLVATDTWNQPVADRIEVTIRRQLQVQGGLSMLMAAQRERDRELRKAMREMAGRTLDEILRG